MMGAAGIALLAALAAMLALPALRASVRRGAGALAASRRQTLDRDLGGAFVFVESADFSRLLVAATAVAVALGWVATGHALAGAAAGLAVLALPAWLARRYVRRRHRRLLAQLPDALDLLAASLRSGLALGPAVAQLAVHQPPPLGQEFALVVRQQRMGMPLERALGAWRERIGGPEVAQFVAALAAARELGGGLADVLARVAATLRERQGIERKIDALTAQGRLQARIVGALPLLLLLAMAKLQPGPTRLMFTTPPGWAALALVAVLEASGAWLLARQVRIDV